MAQMTQADFIVLCRKLTIAFICCLPFLVPFPDASRNIDMQGLVILLAGLCGWIAVLAGFHTSTRKRISPVAVLIAVFVVTMLLSVVINPHFGYNVLGAPHIRLGAGGMLACIGCALVLRHVSIRQLLAWLYTIICLLGLVALPYAWLHLNDVRRIGGLFAQADIFAVFLGCGILLGPYILRHFNNYRNYVVGSQLFLMSLLLLTGTRTVIVLVILLWPLCRQIVAGRWKLQNWLVYTCGVVLLIGSLSILFPSRLTDRAYAKESLSYRFDLQQEAFHASREKPWFGYGPGNLADALDCSGLSAPALQATCREYYFFNSSHNIYLDRILALGWVGGISYILIVAVTIWRGLHASREQRLLTCCLILIASYYLTNVTAIAVELLLWILIFQIWRPSRALTSR